MIYCTINNATNHTNNEQKDLLFIYYRNCKVFSISIKITFQYVVKSSLIAYKDSPRTLKLNPLPGRPDLFAIPEPLFSTPTEDAELSLVIGIEAATYFPHTIETASAYITRFFFLNNTDIFSKHTITLNVNQLTRRRVCWTALYTGFMEQNSSTNVVMKYTL